MKNIIKDILVSQMSFPLKYKNEKEIWWKDVWGDPLTIEIIDVENEQYVSREYHEDGRLWCKEDYCQGQPHGEHLQWYYDGQLSVKENYYQGHLHGECLEYDGSGQLRYKENYYQGHLHGECSMWDWDGKPIYKKEYNHGELINEKRY